MKWLIPHVGPVALHIGRVLLPPVLVAGLAALVDVGLLDGAVYETLRHALSAL